MKSASFLGSVEFVALIASHTALKASPARTAYIEAGALPYFFVNFCGEILASGVARSCGTGALTKENLRAAGAPAIFIRSGLLSCVAADNRNLQIHFHFLAEKKSCFRIVASIENCFRIDGFDFCKDC